MAARKWYQDPKIAVPIAVALITLVGTIVTVLGEREEDKEPQEDVAQVAPRVPATTTPPPPAPVSVLAFPVVVIDDSTGEHISGARVVADEQGLSTETDSQGRCTLAVKPGLGKLRVTVSRPGYRTQNVELTVFEGMDPARIRLQQS